MCLHVATKVNNDAPIRCQTFLICIENNDVLKDQEDSKQTYILIVCFYINNSLNYSVEVIFTL